MEAITWPEFQELMAIAETEHVGQDRADFQFALLTKATSGNKHATIEHFLPYTDGEAEDPIDAYIRYRYGSPDNGTSDSDYSNGNGAN